MDLDMESETITSIHEPSDGGGVVDNDNDFDDSTNQPEQLTNDNEEEPTSTDIRTITDVSELDTKQKNEEEVKGNEQANIKDTKQEDKEADQEVKDDVKPVEETSIKERPDKIKSRELKSLIAAAKESNLDTNIVHKRKSVQDNSDTVSNGTTSSPSTSLGTPTSHIKRNMRSQNPEFVAKHHKFITKCITNDNIIEDERDSSSISDDKTSLKRKRDSISSTNTSVSGGSCSPMTDDKKHSSKKLIKLDTTVQLIKPGQDVYCWQCHKDGIQIQCVACVRSYHLRCLRHAMPVCENWTCSECMLCLEAENADSRSLARQRLNDQQFQQVLKFALKRMVNVSGAEPFKNAVDSNELNDYHMYVVHPVDLNQLKYNIDQFKYKSTQSFIADTKWILHNSMIYNSSQSKLTSVAKSIVKTCKIEMAEIETCPECYINANTHKDTWFIEVCSKPHILVWAKLKGFPFWPAKAVNTNDTTSMVDVRFFGQHDKAWVPVKDVYLYSTKDPNTLNKHQKNNIVESLKEVELHIDKLKKRFGTFIPAAVRTPFEPNNELQQLKMLLPNYQLSSPTININKLEPHVKIIKKLFNNNYNKNKGHNKANSSVGYGTEDDEVDDEDNDNDNSDNDDDEDDKEEEQDSDNSSTLKTYTRNKIERTPVRASNTSSRRTSSTSASAALFDKPNTSSSQIITNTPSSGRKRRSSSRSKRRDSDVSSTKSYKSDTSSSVDHLKINKIESFNEMTEIKLTGVVAAATSTTTTNKNSSPIVDKTTSSIKISKPIIQVNPIELINTNTEIQLLTSSTIQNNTDNMTNNTDITNNPGKDDKKQEELSINKTILNKQKQYINKNKNNELRKQVLTKNKDDEGDDSVNDDEADNDEEDSQSLNIDEQLPEQEKDSDYEPDDTDDTDDDDIEDDEDDTDNIVKDKTSEKAKETTKLNVATKPATDTKVTLVDVKKIILGNENKNDKMNNIKTTTITTTLSSATVTTTNTLNKTLDNKTLEKVIDNKKTNVDDKQQEQEKPQQNDNKQVISTNSVINSKQQNDEQLDPNIDIKEEVLDDTDDDEDTATSTIATSNDKQQQPLLPTLNISPNVTVSKIKKNKNVITPLTSVTNDNISNKFNKLKKVNNYVLADEKIKTKPLIQLQQQPINNSTIKSTANDDNVIKTIENVVKGCGNLVKPLQDAQSTAPQQPPKRTSELKVISVAEINKKRSTINISSPSSSTTSIQPTSAAPLTMPITSTNMNVKQKARKSFPTKNHIQHITLNTTATTKRINTNNNNNSNKMMMMMTTNKTSASDKDKMVYIPTSSCNSTLSLSSLTSSTSTTTTPSVTILQQQPQQPNTTYNTTKFIVPQNIFTSLQQTHSNGGGIALVSTGTGGQTKTTPIQQIIPIQHATTASTTILNDEVQRNTNDGLPPLRPRPGTSTTSNTNAIKLISPLNTMLNDTAVSAPPIPSSAGPVVQLLNKSAQQMSDYFRSIIFETLSDLSNIGCLEAKIKQLQIELEQQKHKHYEEIATLKYEIAALKQTHLSEKQRIIHETRQACEQDRIRAVDEAKSKQWCAMCLKESQYRCCWSTSYCSYVCQRNHWPTHQTKCQQNVEKLINNTTTATLTTNTNTTSTTDTNETIIKTVKNNSYNTTNNVKNKQHQQLTNKNMANKATSNKINLVTSSKSNGPTATSSSPSPSSGSATSNSSGVVVGNGNNTNSVPTLTFVQNSSGGIELVNHGPIALGGKLIPTSQFTSKIKGYLVSTNALAQQQQQQVINTTTATQSPPVTTSTTSNDKDVENMIID